MKYIGIGLIILTGVFSGYYFSNCYARRLKELVKLQNLIYLIKSKIRYMAMPLDEIFCQSDIQSLQLPFINNCTKEKNQTVNLHSRLENELKIYKLNNLLKEIDYDLLFNFINGLGKSDIDGQLAHCELYYESFSKQIENATIQRDKKSKMVFTLCSMGGFAISILLV